MKPLGKKKLIFQITSRVKLPWSQRFSFAVKRGDKREKEAASERKRLVVGDANLTIMLQ